MAREMKTSLTANLIRTGSAARMLGCSPSYLLALVRSGKIAAQEIDGFHFFDKAAVEGYAAARKQPTMRTNDARHRGKTIVAVLRQEKRVTVVPRDVNTANREHYAGR
jgi:hypothetical protein